MARAGGWAVIDMSQFVYQIYYCRRSSPGYVLHRDLGTAAGTQGILCLQVAMRMWCAIRHQRHLGNRPLDWMSAASFISMAGSDFGRLRSDSSFLMGAGTGGFCLAMLLRLYLPASSANTLWPDRRSEPFPNATPQPVA